MPPKSKPKPKSAAEKLTNGRFGPKLYEKIIENVDTHVKAGEFDKCGNASAKPDIERMSEEFENCMLNCFRGEFKLPNSGDLGEDEVKELVKKTWETPGVYYNTIGFTQEDIVNWIMEALDAADEEPKDKTKRFAEYLREQIKDYDGDDGWFCMAGYGLGIDAGMIGQTEFFIDLLFNVSGLRIVIWKNNRH